MRMLSISTAVAAMFSLSGCVVEETYQTTQYVHPVPVQREYVSSTTYYTNVKPSHRHHHHHQEQPRVIERTVVAPPAPTPAYRYPSTERVVVPVPHQPVAPVPVPVPDRSERVVVPVPNQSERVVVPVPPQDGSVEDSNSVVAPTPSNGSISRTVVSPM